VINAYIAGTGFYVPPRVVTNQMLADEYGIETTHEWILQRTGIEERRYADEGVGTSHLAVPASEAAIAEAGLDKKDIDLIILATLSPDFHFPGTAVYLQKRLGLVDGDDPRFVPTLDIRNQCSGFVYGLSVASAMVKTGTHKNVLLVGAETHSAALDFTTRGRQVTTLFGAGAVVVSATEEDRGVRGCYLGTDSRHADALHMDIWDVTKRPLFHLDEEGRAVESTAVAAVVRVAESLRPPERAAHTGYGQSSSGLLVFSHALTCASNSVARSTHSRTADSGTVSPP
jgi:3-oxoacyl-[acyl-carrier-protein] synthase-3